MPNQYVNKVDLADGTTLIDLSSDTATEADVVNGKYFHLASGQRTVGTSPGFNYVTPEQFGAVGDGETDDSEAVQDACDAGYAVYFDSGKTYYLASAVTIDHDCHLFGGDGATIKTATPSGGTVNNGIVIAGTLKDTTALTSNYTSAHVASADNCANKFTFADMSEVEVGDIIVISATDQYYNYSRSYYHLGATLMVTDVYGGHVYTSEPMPWDITNSQYVTVSIYSAPTAIVENLHFVSDLDSIGAYRYLLYLAQCKDSVVRNCTFANMANGIRAEYCFNLRFDGIMLSKSKYDNSLSGDGYGVYMMSCTNTIIERVTATCAQHAIAITGNEPSINTYVRNCDLSAECRNAGLNAHEASYNLVVEDCKLGGVSACGTIIFNRCEFFSNERPGAETGVTICGSHNPAWATARFNECTFSSFGVTVTDSAPQSPIQSFDSVFDSVIFENCIGGKFVYTPSLNATILSDTINSLVIDSWKDCYEIYNPGNGKIKRLSITNTNFGKAYFLTDHTDAHGLITSNIEQINIDGKSPPTSKLFVNRATCGERYTLPEGVTITLSSTNSSAKYRVCGINLTPNVLDDYIVGDVGGTAGNALTRTAYTGSNVSLTLNSSGYPVYTQGNNTSTYSFYPVGMFLVTETSTVAISATLTDTGSASGVKFYPAIAVVDASTGLLTYRGLGTGVDATSAGASISQSRVVTAGNVVLCYFFCGAAVANAVTTFADMSITCTPIFGAPVVNVPYEAKRRTGDGTLTSVAGVNNIMCSDTSFSVQFAADLVNNPIGILPSASGVSF